MRQPDLDNLFGPEYPEKLRLLTTRDMFNVVFAAQSSRRDGGQPHFEH